MASTIRLKIKLTPAQKKIDESRARFKIIKAGRRFGKTNYAAYWILRNALLRPGLHWYCAKTMSLARDEFWPRLLELIPEGAIATDKRGQPIRNDRDYRVTLINGSIIACVSADKEDNLRGRKIASLVVDEASFLRQTLWAYVLQATVADLKSPVLFISSPRRGWFTRQWQLANDKKLPDWAAFKFTIFDNPHIDPLEAERIKKSTPETVWLQEYMAEEQDHQGLVYTEFSEDSIFNADHSFSDYKSWPCVVGMDYGLSDDTAVVWLHVSPEGYVVVSKTHIRNGWDVSRHASVIHQNSKGLKIEFGNYVLDRSAFRMEATSRTSIADKFRENGITCVRSEKDVLVGMDIMKKFLRGDGKPWIYFSTRCPDIIRTIQEWEYDQHEPDVLAALRYGLVHIVKKKMTAYADAVPLFTNKEGDLDMTPDAVAPNTRVLPGWGQKPKRTQWSWDYEAGGLL